MKKIRTLDNNRLDTVEQWIGEKQAELSDFNLLENFNFLVNTVKEYSEGVRQLREENQGLQRNQMILQEYMHEKKVDGDFEAWIEEKRKKEEDENTEISEKDDNESIREEKKD
tara:strand:+ start:28 stop:366 length:339 start_codon:yes stop_codon:yes gene_type:complete